MAGRAAASGLAPIRGMTVPEFASGDAPASSVAARRTRVRGKNLKSTGWLGGAESDLDGETPRSDLTRVAGESVAESRRKSAHLESDSDDPADPPFRRVTIADRFSRSFRMFADGEDEIGADEFNRALGESRLANLRSTADEMIRRTIEQSVARRNFSRVTLLDVTRGALAWLADSERDQLLDIAADAYRQGLSRSGRDGTDASMRAYLLRLQEMRENKRFTGLHWPKPRHQYANGTPFVERVVCFADGAQEFHRERVRARLGYLREQHPASQIILRIDYRAGIAVPRTEAERDEYYPRLAEIMGAEEFQGILIQQGNEPQFEGSPTPEALAREFNGWGRPASDTRNFWMTAAQHNPWAPRLPPAIAPFNAQGPNIDNPYGVEDSPWAQLAYQAKSKIVEAGLEFDRMPHGWSEHVYGDPPRLEANPEFEPWAEPRDSHGWRWQMNVADTWQEVNKSIEDQFGIPPLDVWVTEFNTSARGPDTSRKPVNNYPRGWMLHSIARFAASFARFRGAAWFVGDAAGHDSSWRDYAIHERTGRLGVAEDDFLSMLDQGL